MAITISSGANEASLEVAGQTVERIRTSTAQMLNISDEAVPHVNGECVNASYVLREGDELEFVKPAGAKGLSR